MSDILSEKTTSDASSDATSLSQRFQDQLESILRKLKTNPSGITADEARILTENVVTRDDRAELSHAQAPHRSLLMAAKDLHVAVDGSHEEATNEVLRVAQSIVSKLQKAVGHTNAPHPEVEAELQEEIAKIEPKIAQGTVTKAEADHLHSLEARAHGHTEKGGIAAAAQSVAARRERRLSLSSGSGSISSPISGRSRANSRNFTSPQQHSRQERLNEFHHAEMAARPKMESSTATKPDSDHPHSLDVHAISGTERNSIPARRESVTSSARPRANSKSVSSPEEQSRHNKDENLRNTEAFFKPKIENSTISHVDADTIHPREMRAPGNNGTHSLSATAQSFTSRRRQDSLSDVSNSSATEHHKEHSQLDKDLHKVDEGLEDEENEAYKKHRMDDGHGYVDDNGNHQLEDGEICRCCGYNN
ncbi:hypothetical protein G6011_07482 [Alternaria panax]|uniref:SMP domain-containing protein n=1 Tax=Alternaria panax TaxID=48097 RepID=A0AAD4FFC6_9PLEO|nr:hypothetical protein G6011_07482 [Alternaria panax]